MIYTLFSLIFAIRIVASCSAGPAPVGEQADSQNIEEHNKCSNLPRPTFFFISLASPNSITMPPAFATQHLDELVREFLLFRGFTATYKVSSWYIALRTKGY